MVGLIMFKISFFHFITYSRKKNISLNYLHAYIMHSMLTSLGVTLFFHTQIFRYSIQSNIQHFYCGLKQWIVQCFKNQTINQFWAYTILMVSFIFLHLICVIARLYLCLLVHVTFEICYDTNKYVFMYVLSLRQGSLPLAHVSIRKKFLQNSSISGLF